MRWKVKSPPIAQLRKFPVIFASQDKKKKDFESEHGFLKRTLNLATLKTWLREYATRVTASSRYADWVLVNSDSLSKTYTL